MGDKESAFRDFERMGVEHVKLWLSANQNRTAPSVVARRELAAEWLAPHESQGNAESKRLTRSAKNAAWAAAIAAIIAAIAAIVSAVIAFSGQAPS